MRKLPSMGGSIGGATSDMNSSSNPSGTTNVLAPCLDLMKLCKKEGVGDKELNKTFGQFWLDNNGKDDKSFEDLWGNLDTEKKEIDGKKTEVVKGWGIQKDDLKTAMQSFRSGDSKAGAKKLSDSLDDDDKKSIGEKMEKAGQTAQVVAKTGKVVGTAMQVGGTAMKAGGKVVEGVGAGMSQAGQALMSSQIGASFGALLKAGGYAVQETGKGAQEAGEGLKEGGKAVKQGSDILDDLGEKCSDAGQEIKNGAFPNSLVDLESSMEGEGMDNAIGDSMNLGPKLPRSKSL